MDASLDCWLSLVVLFCAESLPPELLLLEVLQPANTDPAAIAQIADSARKALLVNKRLDVVVVASALS